MRRGERCGERRLVGGGELHHREEARAAHLVFEHAVASPPVGLGGDARTVLTELAGVAAGAGDRHPVHDEATADAARSAVEIDHVVDAARGAVEVLGDRAQTRVVADHGVQPGRVGDEVAHGRIGPVQVRGVAHESVGGADESRNGEPHRDDARAVERAGAPLRDPLRDDRSRLCRAEEVVDVDALAQHDPAVEPDGGHRDRVDLGVHRHRKDPRGDGDDGGGPADSPRRIGCALFDQPRACEL